MPSRANQADLLTSKRELKEQYRDNSNLNARSAIYRYGVNSAAPWPRWVFDQLAPSRLSADARVLEVGCGDGALWRKNLDRLPDGWKLVLTDLSPGMLAAARADLPFPCVRCNAERIALPDATCHAVVANHMLYHVPDRPRALAEIRRVLVPGGRLLAATNGDGHLAAITALINEFMTSTSPFTQGMPFSLENGEAQLRAFFPRVSVQRLQGELRVTDPAAVVAYVMSVTGAPEQINGPRRDDLWTRVRDEIARAGAFVVRTDAGLFEAMK